MRALGGGDVTGMPAVMQQVGNNESHQESGLIFKVMDKNDPKVKAAIVHYRECLQVRVLLTPQTTLKNKHSYDTLNSKRRALKIL
jgi:hypothetical protein